MFRDFHFKFHELFELVPLLSSKILAQEKLRKKLASQEKVDEMLAQEIIEKILAQEKGRCQLSSSCYNGAKKLPQVLSEIYWSAFIVKLIFLTDI